MTLKRFFALEGIDGSGTTTQLDLVGRRMASSGLSVFQTCEPTKGPIGALIRDALSGRARIGQHALAHLFAADREEHVNGPGGIREALEKGSAVLSDRYFFSSLAYQTISDKPDLAFSLNGGFPLPQALFFLDIDPELSLERIRGRGSMEIFETLPFQREVARRYRSIIGLYGETEMKIHVIDARLPPDSVCDEIWELLGPLLYDA
jgi:dTMP kinase